MGSHQDRVVVNVYPVWFRFGYQTTDKHCARGQCISTCGRRVVILNEQQSGIA
jgi:hypothetical protein